MNCEEARKLIDAYIDGELSEAEKRALMNHAQACEQCARELEAAELLRDTLSNMDEDIQVPLKAQVAWRNAVRAEAKKNKKRKWMRASYAAAAVAVLLVGGGFALRENPQHQVMAVRTVDAPVAANELIARDGMAQDAANAAESVGDYTAWKKISSQNLQQDREVLKMLAAEYNANFEEQGMDICRVELPQEYLDDFLNAASRIGEELSFEMVCDDTQLDYVIIFQFCEE